MKHRSSLIAFAATLALLPAIATAGHYTFMDGYDGPWEWDEITMTVQTDGLSTYYKGTARITGYSGSATEITIPSKISWSHDVTVADVSTHFEYEVEIVGIANYAFSGYGGGWDDWGNSNPPRSSYYLHNRSITSVTIPNSVTNIGYSAFEYCSGLTSVTIPNSVISIGAGAFEYCSSLTSVTIPNSVTSINASTFHCCGLTSVAIPNSVTSIGNCAFQGCSGLTSVAIPNSVTSIGYSAFSGCGLMSVTIPDSVTIIGGDAFSCSGLTSATINGDASVSKYYYSYSGDLFYTSPFRGCANLRTVELGGRMTEIGHCMFEGLPSLVSITIPASVTNIGYRAFYGCTGLTSATIMGNPGFSVCNDYSYGQYNNDYGFTFSGCTNLRTVDLGSAMTKIATYMFSGCSSLETITIPPTVTIIENRAFQYCSGLRNVHLSDIAAWCAIDFKDASSYLFSRASNLYVDGRLVTSLVIPEGVKTIPPFAFNNCDCLQSVYIPDSVVTIGESAFSSCDNLTAVRVPQSAMTLGLGGLFPSSYQKLRSVTLGANVESIRDDEFDNFRALEELAVAVGNASYRVSGDGCLYDAGLTTLIACPRINAGVTIPNGVTSIGNFAFQYCTNLVSVSTPETVQRIGSYSFSSCAKLSGLTIPEGVQSLATTAFDGCNVLWTEWYRALANLAANGGGASGAGQSGGGESPDPRYALAANVADRAIATVTMDGDCAIDAFALTDGKVYDTVLRVINVSNHPSTLTLPSGYSYERLKGTSPLTIPALSTNLLTITRTADRVFFVAREEMESAQ